MNIQDNHKYHSVASLEEITKQERDDAFGSYLMMFVFIAVGFPFPFVNFIAALIYCVAMRQKSRFVRFHAWQSFLSQSPITLLNAVVFIVFAVRIFLSIKQFINEEDWNNFYYYNEVVFSTWSRVSEQDGWWIFSTRMLQLLIISFLINVVYAVFSIIAAIKANEGKLYFLWFFGMWAYHIVYKKRPDEIDTGEHSNAEEDIGRNEANKNDISQADTPNEV